MLRVQGVGVRAPGTARGRLHRRGPDVRVLAGIDLAVAEGQRAWLVGEPGSGVDELVRLLARVGEPPDTGRITLLGIDLAHPNRGQAATLRRGTAVLGVPGASGLVGAAPKRTPRELLGGLLPGTVTGAARTERVEALLDAAEVPEAARGTRVAALDPLTAALVELAAAGAAAPALMLVALDGLDASLAAAALATGEALRASGTVVVVAAGALPPSLGAEEQALVLSGGRIVEAFAGAGPATALHPAALALAESRALAQGPEASTPPPGPRPTVDDPGCPFRARCLRAQARCAAEMPPLRPPLGADHPVACWFPEPGDAPAGEPPHQEPTARDFAAG